MVEALPNLLFDFVPALATAICDVAVGTFAASMRPWRYVCSSKYRARIHAELSGRPALARYSHMAWGTSAVVASAILTGAVLTLPPKNVSLAECFNASKENGNDEGNEGAVHA
jgi:hypothetical protein